MSNDLMAAALMRAAVEGNSDVIAALIAAGADVNARTDEGTTALITAALWNHLDAVRLLLAHGADPHAADAEGWTAAAIAQARGYRELANLFTSVEEAS